MEPTNDMTAGDSDEYLTEDVSRSDLGIYALRFTGERAAVPEFTIPATGDELYGLDVSHYQSKIEWSRMGSSRVFFTVAKATEGKWKDATFAQNWASMAKVRNQGSDAGKPCYFRGAYHFFRPEIDPIVQADLYSASVGRLEPGDLPPCLDIEWSFANWKEQKDDRWDTLAMADRAKVIQKWLDRVEAALGRVPIIYTSTPFWNSKIGNLSAFARYPLWVADYSNRSFKAGAPYQLPSSWSKWSIWQFSDNCRCDAVGGPADVDRFNGSLSDLMGLAGVHVPSAKPHSPASSAHDGGGTGGSTAGASTGGTGGSTAGTSTGQTLKKGDRGAQVEALQDALVALGHLTAADKATGPGNFGSKTEAALKAFQSCNGCQASGVYDATTQAAMKAVHDGIRRGAKGAQVQALQERLVALGALTSAQLATGPGNFGPATEGAVKAHQQKRHLTASGIIDPATYRSMLA